MRRGEPYQMREPGEVRVPQNLLIWVGADQWRLVALKVPEARTQCPTIIVFTTPVGFVSETLTFGRPSCKKKLSFAGKEFSPSELCPNKHFLF